MMQLVPIPSTDKALNDLFPFWSPFLKDIARRSKEPIVDLLAKVARKEVQPILVWDEIEQKAVALVGMRYHQRGNDIIAELVWMTGRGMKRWRHLLTDLERYLHEHVGVTELRPVCRPGWSPFLKQRGYRVTHYTMEKKLKG